MKKSKDNICKLLDLLPQETLYKISKHFVKDENNKGYSCTQLSKYLAIKYNSLKGEEQYSFISTVSKYLGYKDI